MKDEKRAEFIAMLERNGAQTTLAGDVKIGNVYYTCDAVHDAIKTLVIAQHLNTIDNAHRLLHAILVDSRVINPAEK